MKSAAIKISWVYLGLFLSGMTGCESASEVETVSASTPTATPEAGRKTPSTDVVTPESPIPGSAGDAMPEGIEPAADTTSPDHPATERQEPTTAVERRPEPVDAFETPLSVIELRPETVDAFETPLRVIELGPEPVDAFETPVAVVDARPEPVDAFETPATLTENAPTYESSTRFLRCDTGPGEVPCGPRRDVSRLAP